MKTIIIKDLNEQESDEMRQAFAASAHLRARLRKILKDKADVNNRTTRAKDAYGIANWAYLQADAVGYERAMQEVISILTAEAEPADRVGEERDASNTNRPRGRPRKIVEQK